MAARAEGVVLSTTAPGLTVGSVIADDQKLSLPDGAMAAVLLASGQVVKVSGPFDGPIAAAAHDAPSQLAFLQDWHQADFSALGGARSAGSMVPALPSVVDATRSAAWCLPAQGSLSVAGPARAPASLSLQDTATGATAQLVWTQAQGPQPWPRTVPLRDGTTIAARWNGGTTAAQLTFHQVPADGSADSLIHWAAAGCGAQVAPVLRGLGQKVTPFALYLSTERGRSPHYAVGEPVNLVVQVNRPAALYCAILQEGRARPMFAESGGRRELAEQTELHIPADHLPVDITAPPPRLAELRCYAVPPDPQTTARIDWPSITAGADGATSNGLDHAFAALPDNAVATDHLVVTTE